MGQATAGFHLKNFKIGPTHLEMFENQKQFTTA